jgi:hypothetical protein
MVSGFRSGFIGKVAQQFLLANVALQFPYREQHLPDDFLVEDLAAVKRNHYPAPDLK